MERCRIFRLGCQTMAGPTIHDLAMLIFKLSSLDVIGTFFMYRWRPFFEKKEKNVQVIGPSREESLHSSEGNIDGYS